VFYESAHEYITLWNTLWRVIPLYGRIYSAKGRKGKNGHLEKTKPHTLPKRESEFFE